MPAVRIPAHSRRSSGRLGRRTLGVVGGAGALLVALALAAPIVLAGTPATVGWRDHSFAGAGLSRATQDKPQSKLWYAGGRWWGGLFVVKTTPPVSEFRIHRLDLASQTWIDTGVQLDSRDRSNADYLYDPAVQKLYVVSAHPGGTSENPDGAVRLYRYGLAGSSWTRDPGFPITIANGGTPTATIAKDSRGRLWVAFPQLTVAKVVASTSDGDAATTADELTWGAPFALPAQTEALGLDSLGRTNETTAVVAFDGKVGVWWSNHNQDKLVLADPTAFFVTHDDAQADAATWNAREVVDQGPAAVDNHVNLKVDGTGRVYAAYKTGWDGNPDPTKPIIRLARRATSGAWSKVTVSTNAELATRPQVAVNDELGVAYVFMAAPNGGGQILYKSSPVADLAFARGLGTPFIASATDGNIDDPSTAKTNPTGATGIAVAAADWRTRRYFHNVLPLAAADSTAPVAAPPVIDGGVAATRLLAVSVAVPATDPGSGVSLVRLANSPGTSGGVLSSGTSFAYATPVAWTLAAGGDGTRTVYVQWRDSAGNWSAVQSDTIDLDTTGPVPGAIAIAAGAPSVNALAVQVAVAGVAPDATSLRLSNVADFTDATLFAANLASVPWTLAAGGDGPRTVYAQWSDALGNWSSTASDTIAYDTVAPAPGAVSITNADPTSTLDLVLDVTNADPDVVAVRASTSPSFPGAVSVPYAATIPFTLPAGDGLRTVYVQWADAAGNWSTTATDSITVETRAPEGTIAIAGGATGTRTLATTVSFITADTDIVAYRIAASPAALAAAPWLPYATPVPWTLAAGANGPRTVYVQWKDAATPANESAVLSDTIAYDTVAPVTSSLTSRFATGRMLGASTLPVRLSWRRSDVGAGIARQEIWRSVNGGTYVRIATITTASYFDTGLAPGAVFRFRVRAIDGAGNASPFAYGTAFRTSALQETSTSIVYAGRWSRTVVTGAYGGYVRSASVLGASASVRVYGRSVGWASTFAPSRGKARVYVDGVLAATIDLGSPTVAARTLAFTRSWTTVGFHTLRIVVLGTAGRPRVDLDAVTVLR